MKTVFEPTVGMIPVDTSYCPGCSHGVAHRIIMEVLAERGELGNTIGVVPIGCSINAHHFMNVDMCESTHGRAPAIASGIRRVHPDKVVFTYQGDGDLASIGAGEILHAAHRGEKFTTFFINNAIYGMTGGQMAPTTLIGQRATTCVDGRTVEQAGMPLKMCEILAAVPCAVYVERVMLNNPANVRKAKKAV
ncbi:MAG: 2-oxoglutarate oxidoreductase, partial [Ruminococcaceae bacterium]|nr:2-oxoglutarate oxidoreductase [Oscillospiraceae bacterium]